MFILNIKNKALKKLAEIESAQKQAVKTILLILKNDPIPFRKADVCKLKGLNNTYRIRIGEIRIVYEVQWKEKTIIIQYVGSREKAYE
jgi:mRNA interferase RelE/StbE